MKLQKLNNLTVLLVEDDPITNFISMRKFHEKGIKKVESAENGLLALRHMEIENNIPDLIMLDLNMPVMDGFEFLHAIEHIGKYKDIKIGILTSSIRISDKETAFAYPHVIDFIEKPMDACKLNVFLEKAGIIGLIDKTG